MFGPFISLACLLIFHQNVCIDSFPVINRRSSDDEDKENNYSFNDVDDNAEQLVPEQSTIIVVLDEDKSTVSDEVEYTKKKNTYLPTIRYVEENGKPIVFIRESEEYDGNMPTDNHLDESEGHEITSLSQHNKPMRKKESAFEDNTMQSDNALQERQDLELTSQSQYHKSIKKKETEEADTKPTGDEVDYESASLSRYDKPIKKKEIEEVYVTKPDDNVIYYESASLSQYDKSVTKEEFQEEDGSITNNNVLKKIEYHTSESLHEYTDSTKKKESEEEYVTTYNALKGSQDYESASLSQYEKPIKKKESGEDNDRKPTDNALQGTVYFESKSLSEYAEPKKEKTYKNALSVRDTYDSHSEDESYSEDGEYSSESYTEDESFASESYTEDESFASESYTEDESFASESYTEDESFASESYTEYESFASESYTEDESSDFEHNSDGSDYANQEYTVTTTKKSRHKGPDTVGNRPINQKAKADVMNENSGKTDFGIKIKIHSKRNHGVSRFSYANKTNLHEKDKDVFFKEKNNAKADAVHSKMNFDTFQSDINSYSKERSLVGELTDSKQIYDNREENENYTSKDENVKRVTRQVDKLKKSSRNQTAKERFSAEEGIVKNDIHNYVKSARSNRCETRNCKIYEQIRKSHQKLPRFKLRSHLRKRRNQPPVLKYLKQFRPKRENDKTDELMDQLHKFLIKAKIAEHIRSGLKSTVGPIEVFDFTPLSYSDSLMSESDLSKLFVDHIIPFLTQNKETDKFNKELTKEEISSLKKREMKDENFPTKKKINQEIDIKKRDGRTQDTDSFLGDIFFNPKLPSRSTSRKLMTKETVFPKSEDAILEHQNLKKSSEFTNPSKSSTKIIRKRNSEIDRGSHKNYLKHFVPGGHNFDLAVFENTHFDPRSRRTHFLSPTIKKKRDKTVPVKKEFQYNIFQKNPTSYPALPDLTRTENYTYLPLNVLPHNSHLQTEYSNYDTFNNSSDINVNVPQPSEFVSGRIKYQPVFVVSDNFENIVTPTVTFMTENSATSDSFLDLHPNQPNLYMTPVNVEYSENIPNLNMYMDTNLKNGILPTDSRTNDNFVNDTSVSERFKKSAFSDNTRNDAIEVSIRIPERILFQLAKEAVYGRKNEQPRQAPGMGTQLLSLNLLKNSPRLKDTGQIMRYLGNKNRNLRIGETMIDHKSGYISDKDVNDFEVKRNFQKEKMATNMSSTFDVGQEHFNSDLTTRADLLNKEKNISRNKFFQKKYQTKIHDPEFGKIVNRDRSAETHIPNRQSFENNERNNAVSDNSIENIHIENNDILSEKGLSQNNNSKVNENFIYEKHLENSEKRGIQNRNQSQRLRQLRNRKNNPFFVKTNQNTQTKRKLSTLDYIKKRGNHKRHFRKSRQKQRAKILKNEKLGVVRKKPTTISNHYNFNEKSTESILMESSSVDSKQVADLFLDLIVSSSNVLSKTPEYYGSNFSDVPLDLSFLANSENNNLKIQKDIPFIKKDMRHVESNVTDIRNQKPDNFQIIRSENSTKPLKNKDFERSSNVKSKSNTNEKRFYENLLQNLKGPEVEALLFGNTSLDNFLDSFYKISRNISTGLPGVKRKSDRQVNATKNYQTNPPSQKNNTKTNHKLNHKKVKSHHKKASQEDAKKNADERKKFHELAQNLKRVVRKFVNRHTKDAQEKKLMYREALKRLPGILKKHRKELS